MVSSKLEPIAASDDEQALLAKVEELFNHLSSHPEAQLPRLIAPDGEEIRLPESLFRLLHQVVHQLAQGNGVTVVPFHQPLTTWEAAALLNIPQQHLVQLLNDGKIPFTGEGIKRRIRFDDLMAYQKKWDEFRRQGLAELTRISQELGLYSLEYQQDL